MCGVNKIRVVVWLLTVWPALWSVGCTSRPNPDTFVRRYVALLHSGDIEGLLALHTEDSEFILSGQNPVRGREALRDWFEWDVVLGSELIMKGVDILGDTIVIDTVIARNKWFEALGVPEVRHQPVTRLVLRDGRIAGTYVSGLDEQTRNRVVEEFSILVQWLSENRPDALKRLLPNGRLRFDAASARLWLEVMEKWNTSRQ